MDKNLKKPRVSVLMPVYNGESYIAEAIESILSQTFRDFEFIIINDGSTDSSVNIVKSYNDPRIKLVSNEKNSGLPFTLNRGLSLARGDYIARIDADDISLPRRLEKQVAFMETNPQIAVSGSWIKTIGDKPGFINKFYTIPDDIKASLLFNTSLAHPSTIIRKSVLERQNLYYDHSYRFYEEDYDLWVRLSATCMLANLPEILLLYRTHPKSVTRIYTNDRKNGITEIRKKQLNRLGIEPSQEELYLHNSLFPENQESIDLFLEKEERWLKKILSANRNSNVYKKESLEKIIYKRWCTICGMNTRYGVLAWLKFSNSKLSNLGGGSELYDNLKILAKSFFNKIQ